MIFSPASVTRGSNQRTGPGSIWEVARLPGNGQLSELGISSGARDASGLSFQSARQSTVLEATSSGLRDSALGVSMANTRDVPASNGHQDAGRRSRRSSWYGEGLERDSKGRVFTPGPGPRTPEQLLRSSWRNSLSRRSRTNLSARAEAS